MASSPTYVIDANVIVSAVLLPQSMPRRAFDEALRRGRIAVSASVLKELDDVLRRPRLNKYIREDERIAFLVALVKEAAMVSPEEQIVACRDPKDDKYLEVAVAAEASCLISGDKDLLALHPFRGIPILTPRQFLEDADI